MEQAGPPFSLRISHFQEVIALIRGTLEGGRPCGFSLQPESPARPPETLVLRAPPPGECSRSAVRSSRGSRAVWPGRLGKHGPPRPLLPVRPGTVSQVLRGGSRVAARGCSASGRSLCSVRNCNFHVLDSFVPTIRVAQGSGGSALRGGERVGQCYYWFCLCGQQIHSVSV